MPSPFPFLVDSTSYPSPEKDFIKEKNIIAKSKFLLHHTGGTTISGASATLNNPDYIAVHFGISETGDIYQYFPLNCWAYSLGLKEVAKGSQDCLAATVEIVNPGPLVLRGENLCFWPNDFNAFYCTKSETDRYIELENPWRGYTFYATYNSAQYDSIGKLAGWVCATQNISSEMLFTDWECDVPKFVAFSGVCTHSSCRRDKFDLSPALNWDYLQNLITTAAEYYRLHWQEYENPIIL